MYFTQEGGGYVFFIRFFFFFLFFFKCQIGYYLSMVLKISNGFELYS